MMVAAPPRGVIVDRDGAVRLSGQRNVVGIDNCIADQDRGGRHIDVDNHCQRGGCDAGLILIVFPLDMSMLPEKVMLGPLFG